MKKLFYFILLFGLLQSCSEDDTPKVFQDLEQPTSMTVYCQKTPDEILRKIDYEYNEGNLLKETTKINGEIYSTKTFEYNTENLISTETYKTDLRKVETIYIYNQLNQLINRIFKTTDYDLEGNIVNETESEAPLEYENNLLIKEWVSWGGWHTYEYENGKLVTKNDYTKTGKLHHITKYKYSGDLKVEERKETVAGSVMYIHIFQYDSENKLTRIFEGENIIEENFYDGNRLIEKRTYYFGIDPGFDVCYGNYIYKYEYQ